jgi:hypothetical protein
LPRVRRRRASTPTHAIPFQIAAMPRLASSRSAIPRTSREAQEIRSSSMTSPTRRSGAFSPSLWHGCRHPCRKYKLGRLDRSLARELPHADQNSDVIDSELGKRARLLRARHLVNLHKHVNSLCEAAVDLICWHKFIDVDRALALGPEEFPAPAASARFDCQTDHRRIRACNLSATRQSSPDDLPSSTWLKGQRDRRR